MPPCTDIRLKEFLRETTGLKFEPTSVIVDNRPSSDDFETDDEAETTKQHSSSTDSSSSAASTVASESDEEEFTRLLKSMLPQVKQALATASSVSDDLHSAVRDAQNFGKRREFAPGIVALRMAGQLAKQALDEADAATTAVTATDFPAPMKQVQQSRRQRWEARLADIQPRFNAAICGSTPGVEKLQKVMSYTLNVARQQQFTKALVGLERLERLLKETS